jgi:hypothetical protein
MEVPTIYNAYVMPIFMGNSHWIMIFPWKHGYSWDLTAWLPAGQEKPGGFPQHARLPERESGRDPVHEKTPVFEGLNGI